LACRSDPTIASLLPGDIETPRKQSSAADSDIITGEVRLHLSYLPDLIREHMLPAAENRANKESYSFQ
jgi:hypothetical protein